ncbi:MAG: hypothetical protein FWD64_00820 [Acidobacteriaceae bacterium]|nr:hypothetical protein [Acidobacteriaceae bacterium]
MYNSVFEKNFPKRVHLQHRNGGLYVRIERQNARGVYFWWMFLSTFVFAVFAQVMWEAPGLRFGSTLFVVLIFLLGTAAYLIALVFSIWYAFGVEAISIDGDTLRWTLTALRWHHTKIIRTAEITSVKAITPWTWLDNTVEINTDRRHYYRLGTKLRRDETIELANSLSHAIGCKLS